MRRSRLLNLSVPVLMGKKKPWYLAGGILRANCLAAYKAIGAADIATSFINLANPGTYNLTGGVDPTFNPAVGWTFDGASQYKTTGINPAANATQTMTIIARYSGIAGTTGYLMGGTNGAGGFFAMTPFRGTGRTYWNGGNKAVAPGSAAGVIGMAGLQPYLDGAADGVPTVWADFDCPALYIGAYNNAGVPATYFAGNVQAVAIYNTPLSAAQVLAISNAMAALPFDVTQPAFPGPAWPGTDEFYLVYFGDSHTDSSIGQGVTGSQLETMMAYLEDHATRLNIQAVLFGGDYADSPTETADRAVFVSKLAAIADVPHLLAIGNHDYDNSPARSVTAREAVFGQSYYTGKSWWSGDFYEAGHSENAYLLLTIGAVDYIFIALEFFPRDAVLAWVDALLTTHAARKAIIITHAYEYSDSSVYTDGDDFGPDVYTDQTDADYNWGSDMWATIKTHDNVILVHSGHTSGTARHAANSDGGQAVNQVLFNTQTAPDWTVHAMRFLRFNPTTETINVETFSPVTLQKSTSTGNKFTVTY